MEALISEVIDQIPSVLRLAHDAVPANFSREIARRIIDRVQAAAAEPARELRLKSAS